MPTAAAASAGLGGDLKQQCRECLGHLGLCVVTGRELFVAPTKPAFHVVEWPDFSVGAERDDRIDAGCTSRRNEPREQSDSR